jgi:hypothetical protein
MIVPLRPSTSVPGSIITRQQGAEAGRCSPALKRGLLTFTSPGLQGRGFRRRLNLLVS